MNDGEGMSLARLHLPGVLHTWGFALYVASRDSYQETFLPSGLISGRPEEFLDCACGLYLDGMAT